MNYLFRDCLLNADQRELWRGGDSVTLQPQVFDLLLFLVRQRSRVVTKDQIISEIWKGRSISDSTLSSRIAAARRAIGDDGAEQALIRTITRVGFRFVANVEESASSADLLEAGNSTAVGMPDSGLGAQEAASRRNDFKKAIILVAPFVNLSCLPEKENFAQGIKEDIATALSDFRWIAVSTIDPGWPGRWAFEIREREPSTGIRYLLEGSLRSESGHARLAVRLMDTCNKTQTWARRFDFWEEDSLELQDHISKTVVAAVWPKLERAEIKRARTTALLQDPTHCYLLGMANVYQWTKGGISNALGMFHMASELEPGWAPAYAMAAYCYVQRNSYGWFDDRDAEIAECASLARQAVAFADDDAVSLSIAALAFSAVANDLESGSEFVDQALGINPSLAAAWYVKGWNHLLLGEPEEAIRDLRKALKEGPSDPLEFKMRAALSYAYFFTEHYDEACVESTRSMQAHPGYLTAVRSAAASHASAGRSDKAHILMDFMHAQDPDLRVSALPDMIPFRRPCDAERWADALFRSGLPE